VALVPGRSRNGSTCRYSSGQRAALKLTPQWPDGDACINCSAVGLTMVKSPNGESLAKRS
jgi:hypothetical protein